MKICSRCLLEKAYEDFHVCKRALDGRRAECKECRKSAPDQQPAYRKKNWAAYYKNNTEKLRARARKQRTDNLEHHKNRLKVWRANNPDKQKIQNHKRRAILNKNGVFLVKPKEIQKIRNANCIYCGSKNKIEIDHAFPVIRGGRHSVGNLVPACSHCNRSKGSRTIMEWRLRKDEH